MQEIILPHLQNSLPNDIIKYHISYYTVALEAWRRGLTITFYNRERGSASANRKYQYSISDKKNTFHFICAQGPHTTKEAIDITEHKSKAYTYFKRAGVPVPKGSVFNFNSTSMDDIIDYALSIGYPLVVKATSLQGGKGVYTHISNIHQLKDSLLKVRDQYNSEEVMIEKYINGIDYRLFVLKDKVIGVTKSYSSYVVGDGESNLEELIKIMNVKIKNSRFHHSRRIKIDDDLLSYLKEQKLNLNYVPPKNKRIFLRKHGTHLGLRLNKDCTDEIDSKFKDSAIKAINSIYGIPYGSVDMIIDEETNEGVVNEINTRGEISMHVTPLEGVPRDIPKAIVDYYFPGTKRLTENLYFEMEPIKELFTAGLAKEIVVQDFEIQPLYKQEFTIIGNNLKSPYLSKIYKKASRLHFMGSFKKITENTISIKLYGSALKLEEYRQYLKKSGTKRSKVEEIKSTPLRENFDKHNISLEIK